MRMFVALRSLMRKSDGDRKSEIVKYAKKTRSLLIRLLALVKWAGNSGSVQKCAVSGRWTIFSIRCELLH